MKKIMLFVVVVLMLFSCVKNIQDGFTIKGYIQSGEADIAYLLQDIDRDFIKLDSSEIVNGEFTFTGKVDFPVLYFIQIDSHEKVPFFIQNSTIDMKFDISETLSSDISGSHAQDVWEDYQKETEVFTKVIDQLYVDWRKASQENDEAAMEKVDSLYELESEREKAFLVDYLNKNNDCVVSPYLAYRNAYRLSLEELDKVTSRFLPELDASEYTQKAKEHIRILKSVAIGMPAPEFTMDNPEGEAISLSSFKGNYLLIDFWAAWCRPCRIENPNVVALYAKYHEKGFNILGVSFDRTKEDWLKAVEDDGITWAQVSDIKGWNNRVGKLYGVRSIPHTVLLDPDGIIIEKNLRGEALADKLKEIYD